MSIDPNLLIAAKLIHDECHACNYLSCVGCKLRKICRENRPEYWKIPDPPPEPTERPRIEWLRMLPDGEMLIAIQPYFECHGCRWEYENCSKNNKFTCGNGHVNWWHEVVSLEQFRKDVGLNETDT